MATAETIDIFGSDLRPYDYWSLVARKRVESWQLGDVAGFSTGFKGIDEYSRLIDGDLVVIAARPSQGKTALAIQMALDISAQIDAEETPHGCVAIFSAEMPGWSIPLRLGSSLSGVSIHAAQHGNATPDEYSKLINAINSISDARIWIDDNSGPTTEQMLEQLAGLNTTVGVRAMVFDFMELSGDRGVSENLRLGNIAHNLKGIAKTLGIPVVAISQLNRDVDNRANKIPALSDLRYSGMIEQLADVVLFVVRPEYYVERGLHIECEPADRMGIANIYVSKNRNGPVGTARLGFNGETIQFFDMERVPLMPPGWDPEGENKK